MASLPNTFRRTFTPVLDIFPNPHKSGPYLVCSKTPTNQGRVWHPCQTPITRLFAHAGYPQNTHRAGQCLASLPNTHRRTFTPVLIPRHPQSKAIFGFLKNTHKSRPCLASLPNTFPKPFPPAAGHLPEPAQCRAFFSSAKTPTNHGRVWHPCQTPIAGLFHRCWTLEHP